MKEGTYITIQSWMVNKLGISGNELICYAIIFGFSQDGCSEFQGSQGYIANCLNMTRENARKVLERLVKKNLISKREEIVSGVKFCRYSAIVPKAEGEMKQSTPSAKTEHDNNSNNIDNKEERDKSLSKKDATKGIIQFWNTQTSDFPKVRKQTADIEDKLAKLIKKGYSLEDIKKVILLCNSLPDFYKGREKGKTWKASLTWLLANTKDKFNMIYNGDLHTTFEQQKIYESIMNGNTDDMKMEYRPQLDGFNLHWSEQAKCYISMYDIDMLVDGYTVDNRPSSAMVMKNGVKYKWDTQTKKWEAQ